MSKDTMICRCEDVSEEEIVQFIHMGYETMEELKRVLRVGMGCCQGKTCTQLIEKILLREGMEPDFVDRPTYRPPVIPIRMETLLDSEKERVQ